MKQMKFLSISLILCVFCGTLHAQNFELYQGKQVLAHTIVFKWKSLHKSFSQPSSPYQPTLQFADVLLKIEASTPEQKFPNAYMPESCDECVDLSLIYECEYTADIPIEQVLALFRNLPEIAYAEPLYLEQELYVPNDPKMSLQWIMNTCKIYQAWDIETGDENVVIGITDSGFDIDHIDLVNQIKYNIEDPINGYDDDFDGYVDNFRGWDFGNKDNNPDVADSDHGTWVAGISSAEPDNNFAIAGVGFNTKFLPIKVATDQGYITRGYEGVVYAADHDSDIINCSWGSEGTHSQYAQDVVTYVTYNRNALIVGAAGNSNNDGVFYPASYAGVLSVGAVVLGDEKWTSTANKGSNWNYFVDIVAPGSGFQTLQKNDGTITVSGGTSFASPIVSGVAALVKSYYPDITALELAERIRVTADDIYDISANQEYLHLLGSGRVNALNALNDSVSPSIRRTDFNVANRNGSYMFFPGDTLELYINFKNYLADATNIFVSVACENSYIAPINGTELFASFNSQEEKTTSEPLLFEIVETLPPDVETFFKITYSGNDYFGFEYFPVSFNPSHYNFEINTIKSTATANSTIAHLEPGKTDEYGLVYKNNVSCINEGGLLFSMSPNTVFARVKQKYDFSIVQFPEEVMSDSVDLLIYSAFENDMQKLAIDQYIYAYDDVDALFYEYRISQTTDSVFTDVYVGPYIDWLIMNQTYNKMAFVDSLQLGYAYSLDPWGIYSGIMPLHFHQTYFYAVDDANGLDSVYIKDGFSDEEIHFTLTRNKFVAGNYEDGGMVSSVSGTYIPELQPDSVAVIRFAFILGESLEEIVHTASQIKQNYITDTSTPPTSLSIIENDVNQPTVSQIQSEIQISYPMQSHEVRVSVNSIIGTEKLSKDIPVDVQTGKYTISTLDWHNGFYVLQVQYNDMNYVQKIYVYK
ncbi:MAG: S8 family serine peptidase [Bacteroidales bacterium]|jgi:serine protease|nr:S8 family serine peptidase [Bacteroidales bacterium]